MPANRPSRPAILFALLVFLLPACTQPTAAPTASPTVPAPSATFTLPPTGTDTPLPTATDTPAPTATRPRPKPSSTKTIGPTTTPWPTNTSRPSPTVPTLAPSNARLAYLTQLENGRHAITFMNADGSNRSVVELPEEVHIYRDDLKEALSPDGQWLAFYTGFSESKFGVFTGAPTLKLMHFPDSEIITVTTLLSPDYPANLDRLAVYLLNNDWKGVDNPEAISWMMTDLGETFLNGLRSFSWSPDSRSLAFAGQMAGDSTDVYRYNLQTGNITQLTNGYRNIQSIEWAPSGPWIAHTAATVGSPGMWLYSYAVKSDGSKVVEMGLVEEHKWLNSHTYLVAYGSNGPGSFDLRAIDVETSDVRSLWRDAFISYAFDPRNGNMLIFNYGFFDYFPRGSYLVGLDGKPRIMKDALPIIFFRGGTRHDFVTLSLSEEYGAIGVSANGITNTIASKADDVSVSPDLRWMLLTSSTGIELYDENDALVRLLTNIKPEAMFWRPDSAGLFFITANRLYYAAVPDGNPMLIDSQVVAHEKWEADLIFTWLR